MKHLKPFNRLNESTHYNDLILTIKDILSEISEISDLEHEINVSYFNCGISSQGVLGKEQFIKSRESLKITIGNPGFGESESDYFKLSDVKEPINRLIVWANSEGWKLQSYNIFKMIPLETFKFQYVDDSKRIAKLEIFGKVRSNWDPKEAIDSFLRYKACEIEIFIENSGWQTKTKGSYNGSESDEILQEYKFNTNVEAGEFCKLATELFSSKGHHPDKFIWKDTRVLVSLTSHSAGGVTDKDWEVATDLDKIYTK